MTRFGGSVQTKLPVGVQVAGYRIESFIARGGMAEVYCARDLQLDRQVALKLLAPELAENENFRARFLRESRLAASLDHPHVIPIYSAGMADDLLYLAMRYVQGADLKALLAREGPLSLGRAWLLLSQVGQALDAAHARGLVHRDVKPANVLVGSSGAAAPHVYLSDFGLTKRSTSMTGLTAAGFVAGTIDYIAPEQITAKPVDPQMDMYALGCVLFEVLTGQVPYPRDHDAAVLYAHMFDRPPAVTALRPDLPAGIDDIVAAAMAKQPADRYPACSDLFTDLASLDAVVPRARSAERAAPSSARVEPAFGPTELDAGGPLVGAPTQAPAALLPDPVVQDTVWPDPLVPDPLVRDAVVPDSVVPAPPPNAPGSAPGPHDDPTPPRALQPVPPATWEDSELAASVGAARRWRRGPSRAALVIGALVLAAGTVLGVLRSPLLDPEPVTLPTVVPREGFTVERTWSLGGRDGDRLTSELVVTVDRPAGGVPRIETVEVLPRSLPGKVTSGAGLQEQLSTSIGVRLLVATLAPGERATFTYSVEVPEGPRDVARLQAWTRDQEAARATVAKQILDLRAS